MADAIVTRTEETHGTIKKVSWDITSATDGTATDTTTYAYSGEIVRLVVVPDSGDTQPTDLFDVVVNDEDSYDVATGQGANLSNAATTTVVASMGCVANDKLILSASGMGAENGAAVYVYIR